MTSLTALEVGVSLALQICLIVGACQWLLRCAQDERIGERVWTCSQVLILILTALAWTLPHLRLIDFRDLIQVTEASRITRYESTLASCIYYTWICGVSIQLLRLASGIVQSQRLIRAARRLEDCRANVFLSAEDRDNLSGELEFRISRQVETPFCWQISRPIIVLPKALSEAPLAEVQAIVRHELAHLRAGHPLHLFLQRLVETVHWYHPLVWWSSAKAARSRELVCDDKAVRSADEAVDYLKGLLLLTQSSAERIRLSAGAALQGTGSLLQERAARIARRTWSLPTPAGTGA